jgi:hypothetical protein
MRREPERPTAVLVIAIFHFIFGGLGLVCGLCALGGQAMNMGQPPQQQQMQMEMEQIMVEKVPLYKVYGFTNIGLGLLWDVVLISSGMMMLSLKPPGRQLSIFYGISRLLWGLLSIVYTIIWVNPATEVALQQVKVPPELKGMMGIMSAATSFGLVIQLLLLVYPAIVLIVMYLPAVRVAFAGGPPPRDEFEDDEEDDDDDDDFDDERERRGGEGIQPRPRD